MSTLYVIMVYDNHTDPIPVIRTDRQQAIDDAREYLASQMRPEYANDDELGEQPTPGGWLFYGAWNHEGGSIWVIEVEADGSMP